jgi:hypothetical protein
MRNTLAAMAHKSKLVQGNLKGLTVKYAVVMLKFILEDLERVKDQNLLVEDMHTAPPLPFTGEKTCDG